MEGDNDPQEIRASTQAYCVKCRAHREVDQDNSRYVTNRRGGLMLQAKCPVCDKTINTFVKKANLPEGVEVHPLPPRDSPPPVKRIKKKKTKGVVEPEISPPLGDPYGEV